MAFGKRLSVGLFSKALTERSNVMPTLVTPFTVCFQSETPIDYIRRSKQPHRLYRTV
jgi:hypothetical protein